MTDQTTEQPKGKTPGWIKAALVASLVVNVAIIGLFVGGSMKLKERREGGAMRQIQWIVKLVPDEQHDFTKDTFEARRDDLREISADRAKHMKAIVAAIRAEPFSPEALEYAMKMRRDAGVQRREIVHTTLTEVLAKFTQEERVLFADRLDERLKSMARRQQRK